MGKILEVLKAECKRSLEDTRIELEKYMGITEVSGFVNEKQNDFEWFFSLVKDESETTDVLKIYEYLRNEGKHNLSKIRGIIFRGAEYFDITEKIYRIILSVEETKPERVFDKDFEIPDELTVEEFNKVYNSEEE